MKLYRCDRCQEEMPPTETYAERAHIQIQHSTSFESGRQRLDLCRKCEEALIVWLGQNL